MQAVTKMVWKTIKSYAAQFKHAVTHPREWITWANFVKVLTWVMVRVYALLLIFFMLAIWQLNGTYSRNYAFLLQIAYWNFFGS